MENTSDIIVGTSTTSLPSYQLIHPYLLGIAVVLVTIGGLYAGVISTLVRFFIWSTRRIYTYILRKPVPSFVIRFERNSQQRYSHGHHWFLVLMAAAFGIAPIVTVYVRAALERTHSGLVPPQDFFAEAWYLLNYWQRYPEFVPIDYAWWMTMGFASLDVFMNTVFAIITKWVPEDLKDFKESNPDAITSSDGNNVSAAASVDGDATDSAECAISISASSMPNSVYTPPESVVSYTDIASATGQAPKWRHGFIIVSHNSSDILPVSIRAIMRHVEPWQIFIADNGSTAEEERLTDEVCVAMTEEYKLTHPDYKGPTVNTGHLKKGNKTWAQYAAVAKMAEFLELVESGNTTTGEFWATAINAVTLMDDDVILPENWSQEKCNKLFEENDSNIAIAYPLRADNHDASIWTRMQDAEYLLGDAERFAQGIFATNLFCSGAIATWKLDILARVLERHDATFHGEDLEMGYITHKLTGRNKLEGGKEGANTNHRVALMRDCFVPTTVPVCIVHYWDFLPAPLARKTPRECFWHCGEASLFYQRSRSWDIANHSFFMRFLRVVVSPGGWFSREKFFARLVTFWKVIGIVREYMFLLGVISYLISNPENWLGLIMFILDAGTVWWAFIIIPFTILNMRGFRTSYLMWRPEIVFLYPIVFLMNLTTFIRPVAGIYNLCYYWPFVRFPKTIKDQLKEDPNLSSMVDSTWDITKSTKSFARFYDDMSDTSSFVSGSYNTDLTETNIDKFNNEHTSVDISDLASSSCNFDWRNRVRTSVPYDGPIMPNGKRHRFSLVSITMPHPDRRASNTIVMRMLSQPLTAPSSENA